MGLFDVSGLGEVTNYQPLEIEEPKETFKSMDFDRSITEKVNGLVKMEVINRKFSLKKLLDGYGVDTSASVTYCPFHPDEMTGKPSAKYHSDSDKLYCFSESKQYTAYHALKLLYNQNTDILFRQIWNQLPLEERHEIMDKYNVESVSESEMTPSIWNQYSPLLDKFKTGEITYTQYKNGLYKIFLMINKAESEAVKHHE